MNQSQLCEVTFKDRHNMTRILNVLEGHGFIERRPDETDKRAYRIFPTRAGLAIQRQMAPITERYLEDAFKGFNPAEITSLRNILERIVKNIEERA